jgi:hypothetical protein
MFDLMTYNDCLVLIYVHFCHLIRDLYFFVCSEK